MAIEIIKHGEEGKKYIATYRECGCQFSFNKKDAEHIFFDMDRDHCAQIHCPECYTYLTLSLDNLPTTSV